MFIAVGLSLALMLTLVLIVFYSERKVSAFVQDRLGPMEAGIYGVLQPIADLLKLLQKEDIVPTKADPILFKIAPIIVFVAVFAGFSVLPFCEDYPIANSSSGLFFLLTIISLDIVGLLLAGCSSFNKYSLLGSIRSVSQIISYEIPLGISILCVVVLTQSLDLQEICLQQGLKIFDPKNISQNGLLGSVFGSNSLQFGGLLNWNIIKAPILIPVFIIYFITILAEANRAPFDLPEAESELIGGFHTEYSGFRFGIFFLAEYAMMILLCLLGTILFWGGWNTLLPNIGSLKLADWTTGQAHSIGSYAWGCFWICSKSIVLLLIQVWIRWTLPRLRVDQLMYLCWKVLTPFSLFLLILSCIWRLWFVC